MHVEIGALRDVEPFCLRLKISCQKIHKLGIDDVMILYFYFGY